MDVTLSKKQNWIDGTRVFACFCVVLLHAASPYANNFGKDDWFVAVVYDGLAQSCVPLFLMVTGHLLLNHEDSLQDVLKKRFARILPPLLFWTIFFLAWRFLYRENFNFSFYAIYTLAISPIYYHLWFLYALAGLYLLLPLLQLIFKNAGKMHLMLYMCLWFIENSAIPLITKATSINNKIDLGLTHGLAGYFFLGAILGQAQCDARRIALGSTALIIGAFTTVWGTLWLSERSGGFDATLCDNFSPTVVLMSAGTFFLFKTFQHRFSTQSTLIEKVASASFGIYLIHPFFLETAGPAIYKFLENTPLDSLIISIPLTTLTTLFFSYGAVKTIKKIRFLKRTVI